MRPVHEHQGFGERTALGHYFDDLFLAVRGHAKQLHLANEHQIETGDVFALVEQQLTLIELDDPRMAVNAIKLQLGQA